MQYTIKAVSPDTRSYSTQYGDMVSYRIKFEETDDNTIIELGQKASTPAPTVGQVLNGTIDMSSKFGPKFKKEYNQGGGFTQPATSSPSTSSSPSGKGGFQADPFTMYLSYAKDIAVALIGSKAGYDEEMFGKILEDVTAGGKTLYDDRPGAEKAEPKQAEEKDVVPTADVLDSDVDMSQVAALMADKDAKRDFSPSDIPF